jgi:hypothetical protein
MTTIIFRIEVSCISNIMFDKIKNSPVLQNVYFEKRVRVKFIMIELMGIVSDIDIYLVEELDVIT